MIPVAMPVVIVVLTFLFLMGLSLITVACFDQVARFVRARVFAGAAGEDLVGETTLADAGAGMRPAFSHADGATTPRVEGYALPASLYYHPGHAWVSPREANTAFVGIDEFACKLIGKPSAIRLPKVGDRCRQGAKGWTLSRNERKLDMLFPLDGEVIAVNERVLADPDILSREPYSGGWLMLIKSASLKHNLRNLLSGNVATRWLEESASELRSAFSGNLGMVFQDGGLPEGGLADRFDGSGWQKFANRVFMNEPE